MFKWNLHDYYCPHISCLSFLFHSACQSYSGEEMFKMAIWKLQVRFIDYIFAALVQFGKKIITGFKKFPWKCQGTMTQTWIRQTVIIAMVTGGGCKRYALRTIVVFGFESNNCEGFKMVIEMSIKKKKNEIWKWNIWLLFLMLLNV